MTTDASIAELRDSNDVLWENHRYGAIYVVDRPSILKATPDVAWTVVYLWCPREVAAQRAGARGSTDLEARLAAWDETEPLPNADLTLNTADISAAQAAQLIETAVRSRSSSAPS
jgi:guanylate kinase